MYFSIPHDARVRLEMLTESVRRSAAWKSESEGSSGDETIVSSPRRRIDAGQHPISMATAVFGH